MGIFKKKQQKPETAPRVRTPCEMFGHTWKDFPAYMQAIWNNYTDEGEVTITEPYVCLYCKERKDVELYTANYNNLNKPQFKKVVDVLSEEYKSILKPRGIVEDMINDLIYVDKEKLDAWELLHGKKEREEFKLKVPTAEGR